jgi:hypothetical protein
MNGTRRRFDAACDGALGESWEGMMRKLAIAVNRGDGERARLIETMVASAVQLGTHAMLLELSKSTRT